MRSEAERVTVDFAFGECCTMSPCHRQAGIPQIRFRKVPSHSSLAQSVERVTVNFAFGECCTMSPCHRQAGIPQIRFRKVPSHSSLAQSVERVTVNFAFGECCTMSRLPQASGNTANTVPQGPVTFLLSSVGRARDC